ncbi:MAG: SDR family oxidoreductase [Chloroflexi bacterium]|nr:SDR family oxidoreductase [Chloroflexota bacterium]
MGRLDRKVAVITGAAKGLGKQMALTFAAEGADIAICDIEEMDATAKGIKDLGRKVLVLKADITKKDEVDKFFSSVMDTFKKVDILVNNAGTTRNVGFFDMTGEDWDFIQDANLKGAFFCTQVAARYMKERKYGRIVNMSSVASVSSRPIATVNYQCAKSGVIQLTRACARELGPYGITVNVMAPGIIVTEMTYLNRSRETVDKMVDEGIKRTPLGRLGTPKDVANLALFFALDESSFISGQLIVLDGGWA